MLSNSRFLRGNVRVLWHTSLLIGFLVLILLGLTSEFVQAEPLKTPLYLLLKPEIPPEKAQEDWYKAYLNTGDLWKWNGDSAGKLIQVTHWGFNALPVVSPNGNYVAYQSMPQITIDYLKSDYSHVEGVVQDALPFNLWLLDTQTDMAKRITGQSPSAQFDNDLLGGITRSVPVWSPDSSKIVWIEADSSASMMAVDASKFVPRLMIYDVATEQTEILSNPIALPDYASPQGGGTAMGDMTSQWGSADIAVGYKGSENKDTYVIYDLSGQVQKVLRQEHNDFGVLVYMWLHDGQQDYLATRHTDHWSLYDPKADKNSALRGRIEGYSLLAAQGMTLRDDGNEQWELVDADGKAQALNDCFIDYTKVSIAISPDGKQAACFSGEDTVSIYTKTGLLAQLPANENQFLGMFWGPMGWRIAHNTG